MNNLTTKTIWLLGFVAIALFTPSCSDDELRKELQQANRESRAANDELRKANDELKQANQALREQVAALDRQLAQQRGRFEELQRANEAGSAKAAGNQIAAEAEARLRSETEARGRTEQTRQQAVAAVKKIAAQMDRLLDEIPSLESSLATWDVAMPKVAKLYRDASLQMNLLVAELDGLKFERSEEARRKITGFSNGYQALPGLGRIVVSSREHALALRAAANPSETDLAAATSEEVTMAAQFTVYNATLAECTKLRTEVAKLAD